MKRLNLVLLILSIGFAFSGVTYTFKIQPPFGVTTGQTAFIQDAKPLTDEQLERSRMESIAFGNQSFLKACQDGSELQSRQIAKLIKERDELKAELDSMKGVSTK